MYRRNVSLFFLSLGLTLLAAAFAAAMLSINIQTAAVIGYTPELPLLPRVLIDARWLDCVRSGVRLLFPIGVSAAELMYGALQALLQAV